VSSHYRKAVTHAPVYSVLTANRFFAQVAMTDCDTKERKALSTVFPGIILLICLWHMSNAYNNRLRNDLSGGPRRGDDAEQVKAWREQIRKELRSLLDRYKFV